MGKNDSYLSNIIKNRDYFGKPVEIHFNKSGNTHNTIVGGVVSILVNIILGVFVWFNFRKMIFNLDDKISQSKSVINFQA